MAAVQSTPPRVSQANQLVRYDTMCRAIAAAHAVDEVKDIRDRALAIETYSRLAKNTENEWRACEIRLRAERRAGQMLTRMERSGGGRPSKNSGKLEPSFKDTIENAGISATQAKRWQKVAAIPEKDFEATFVKVEKRPSTNGLIAAHGPKPNANLKVDPKALWLWGRLMDFENQGILETDPAKLFATMLDHMKDTTKELAPKVSTWLRRWPR